MMRNRRVWGLGLIWVLVVLLIAGWQGSLRAADVDVHAQSGGPGSSYVYLFDKASSSFVFTFTHPLLNANLIDVKVVPGSDPTEVWFTEFGAARLGKLVYTDTQDYVYQPYAVSAGSAPLNLVLDGGYAWFTAPGRNAIGRVNRTTGAIDEFAIPTNASYPADLDAAGDGSIWFTERDAGQIAHLVVTSTVDYRVDEYQGPLMEDGRPYGLDVIPGVDSGEIVFFSQPANSKITRFTPQEGKWLDISGQLIEQPFNVVAESVTVAWSTDRSGNGMDWFTYDTFFKGFQFEVTPENSDPYGLVLGSGGDVWFTQHLAGQLGRLDQPSMDRSYFALPMDRVSPTGIAEDGRDGLWLLSNHLYNVFLPLVFKDV
jgi:streptogramin lyase